MSDSVRPHRQQPTRLPRPWDFPGKNTGLGCHFLLQCMKVKSEREVTQSCPTPSDPMDCSPPGSSVHGIFQARVLEWGASPSTIPRAEGLKQAPQRIREALLKEYGSTLRDSDSAGLHCSKVSRWHGWSTDHILRTTDLGFIP